MFDFPGIEFAGITFEFLGVGHLVEFITGDRIRVRVLSRGLDKVYRMLESCNLEILGGDFGGVHGAGFLKFVCDIGILVHEVLVDFFSFSHAVLLFSDRDFEFLDTCKGVGVRKFIESDKDIVGLLGPGAEVFKVSFGLAGVSQVEDIFPECGGDADLTIHRLLSGIRGHGCVSRTWMIST